MININDYPKLPPEAKVEARMAARENALEEMMPEPKAEDFLHIRNVRFGPKAFRAIVAIMFIMFLVGFVPSAMRIFYVASQSFLTGEEAINGKLGTLPLIGQVTKADLAGASFVFMAEIATISFVIAARIIDNRYLTRWLISMATIAAFAAIVGNLQASLVYDNREALDWIVKLVEKFLYEPFNAIEATLPPIFTLFGGLLLGEVILDHIETTRTQSMALSDARRERHSLSLHIEDTEAFFRNYQDTIWAMYRKCFGRTKGYRETEWTTENIKQIVAREVMEKTIMSREEMALLVKETVEREVPGPLSGNSKKPLPLPSEKAMDIQEQP